MLVEDTNGLQCLRVQQPDRAVRQRRAESPSARGQIEEVSFSLRVPMRASEDDAILGDGEIRPHQACCARQVPKLECRSSTSSEQSVGRKHLEAIHLILFRSASRQVSVAEPSLASQTVTLPFESPVMTRFPSRCQQTRMIWCRRAQPALLLPFHAARSTNPWVAPTDASFEGCVGDSRCQTHALCGQRGDLRGEF